MRRRDSHPQVQQLVSLHPAVHVEVTGVFTHTVQIDAYRGAGRPPVICLVERLVDAAARQLNIDPAELRRRNFIPKDAMPHKTAIEHVYDCGDFPRMMEEALNHADYEGFAARREKSRDARKLRGIGFASYVDNCGRGSEKAAVSVDDKGDVTLVIGTQAIGQGLATGYAQVIAEQLGVDNDRVTTIQGDTDLVATGNGTDGSNSLPVGGVACERAALALIENGKRIAAEVLEASAADIEFADGTFSVVGTDRRVGLAQVAETAIDPKYAADGGNPVCPGTANLRQLFRHFPTAVMSARLKSTAIPAPSIS